MKKLAVSIILLLSSALLVLIAGNWLTYRWDKFECRGVVHSTINDQKDTYGDARLGLSFERLGPFAFWADDKISLDYSVVGIDHKKGTVIREQDVNIELVDWSSIFISAKQEENGRLVMTLFYDQLSKYAGIVVRHDDNHIVSFDGFC